MLGDATIVDNGKMLQQIPILLLFSSKYLTERSESRKPVTLIGIKSVISNRCLVRIPYTLYPYTLYPYTLYLH